MWGGGGLALLDKGGGGGVVDSGGDRAGCQEGSKHGKILRSRYCLMASDDDVPLHETVVLPSMKKELSLVWRSRA